MLVMVLQSGIGSPDLVNRDLMTRVSPRVPADCHGKGYILFNGSQPGLCVAQAPNDVVRAPCVNAKDDKPPD